MTKQKISELAIRFFRDGVNVLVHGHSRVVEFLLTDAFKKQFEFNIFITECRPLNLGCQLAKNLYKYKNQNQEINLIVDSSIGYIMQNIDIIIVGAEAVVENGGIINSIGTYSIGLIAKNFQKPLYVACESLKFARIYPLT